MVRLIDFKAPEINNLIAIATFGSYDTEFWVSNRSDIDILILLEHRIDAQITLELLLTVDMIDSYDVERIGLINKVVPNDGFYFIDKLIML